MEKMNCWEFKKCGREPGGKKVNEFGVCMSAQETRLDQVHGGKNAGRSCWVVAHTLCGGMKQGGFAQKYMNCFECGFRQKVESEESFTITLDKLLRRLRE